MYDDRVILSMRFPQKLWRIVNACKSGAIRWNTDGTTILLDYKKFQEEYLDADKFIFKTGNITSFIRQLNLYGFRKVTSHNRDPLCNSRNPNVHEFLHDYFRAGRVDLLSKVCRKAIGKNKYGQRVVSENAITIQDSPEKIAHSTSRLKMCQLALTETLEQIRRETQRKCWNASRNESSTSSCSSSSSRQGPPELELFNIQQCDLSPETFSRSCTPKRDIRFCPRKILSPVNNDDRSSFFISDTRNPTFYVSLNNAN